MEALVALIACSTICYCSGKLVDHYFWYWPKSKRFVVGLAIYTAIFVLVLIISDAISSTS